VTAEEKITALFNRLLDEREAKQKREADPKTRGADLMARMEAFLDEHEAAKSAKTGKQQAPKGDGDDRGVWAELFGG
jgi:hypothetical protein